MRRNDLYITVPSFFRCPISLNVMKSPVSLCTGVTYDRSSIQRWLDGGNNTCPATMQLLPSKDFVPNHTLHRLIHLWSDSVHLQLHSNSASNSDQIESFIQSLKATSRNECSKTVEYLSKLLSFAEESEQSREFLSKSEGFVQLLVDLLNRDDIEVKRLVVEVLALLLDTLKNQHDLLSALLLKSDRDYLSPLSLILKHGRVRSRIAVARIIECITIDSESNLLIASNEQLLFELVNNLSYDSDSDLIESILSRLISLAMLKRVKVRLVIHHKIIIKLKQILFDKNVTALAAERALNLLETVSCCREGREEMCREEGVVEAVVGKVLKVSAAATEHAVTVLWSVCYLFRDRRAVAAVARSNGLTKVLLILQSGCSPPVRQMVADLLTVFRVDSKMAGVVCSYETKTTHIMPF